MDFKGFGENVLTFKCDNTVKAGSCVKIKSSGTVTAAVDSNDFMGVCLNVRNSCAAVQMNGYTEMKYSGSAPNVGYSRLTSAGTGKVKADTSGREYLVIGVDTANTTVGFIL